MCVCVRVAFNVFFFPTANSSLPMLLTKTKIFQYCHYWNRHLYLTCFLILVGVFYLAGKWFKEVGGMLKYGFRGGCLYPYREAVRFQTKDEA